MGTLQRPRQRVSGRHCAQQRSRLRCSPRYGQESYKCDADTSASLYCECYADSDCDCGDGYFCSSEGLEWRCNSGCIERMQLPIAHRDEPDGIMRQSRARHRRE